MKLYLAWLALILAVGMVSAIGVEISACNTTIDSVEFYFMNGNITQVVGEDCVTFTSGAMGSDVDCGGFALVGGSNTGNGFVFDGVDNMSVENCIVDGFTSNYVFTGNAFNNTFTNDTGMNAYDVDFDCVTTDAQIDGYNFCSSDDTCSGWLTTCPLGWFMGTVTNSTADPIEDANVTTYGVECDGCWNLTDASGAYIIYGVVPGTYNLNASKAGYVYETAGDVPISTDTPTETNFTLTETTPTPSPTPYTPTYTVGDIPGMVIDGIGGYLFVLVGLGGLLATGYAVYYLKNRF